MQTSGKLCAIGLMAMHYTPLLLRRQRLGQLRGPRQRLNYLRASTMMRSWCRGWIQQT